MPHHFKLHYVLTILWSLFNCCSAPLWILMVGFQFLRSVPLMLHMNLLAVFFAKLTTILCSTLLRLTREVNNDLCFVLTGSPNIQGSQGWHQVNRATQWNDTPKNSQLPSRFAREALRLEICLWRKIVKMVVFTYVIQIVARLLQQLLERSILELWNPSENLMAVYIAKWIKTSCSIVYAPTAQARIVSLFAIHRQIQM